MRKNTILDLAHLLVNQDTNCNAIDATLGNGHDSNYLSSLFNHVYSFDILDEAIATSKKLNYHNNNITYIKDGHQNLDKYNISNVSLVIYNLGYLPGYDKTITTLFETTIISLKKSVNMINSNGKIIIVIYTGHDNGKIESLHIKEYVQQLDKYKFDVIEHKLINKDNNPPYIIEIRKK